MPHDDFTASPLGIGLDPLPHTCTLAHLFLSAPSEAKGLGTKKKIIESKKNPEGGELSDTPSLLGPKVTYMVLE